MNADRRLSITCPVGSGSHQNVHPKSFYQKIKIIFTNITVEPIMICYLLPCIMASLATQNLSLEKACRVNLRYNDSICDALQARNSSAYDVNHEIEVQRLVASMNAWKNVLQSLLPSMLLMFIGSWSDRHNRRKPCILLPLVGELTCCVCLLLCTYFFYELAMEINALAEAVPPSLTGGWFCMMLGVYSYVSSISTKEMRTLRIGAANVFAEVSITIGTALSGIMYKSIGFYGVFGLSSLMYVTGLLYGCYTISELKKEHLEEKKSGFFNDFFDLKHIFETFKVAFKTGSRNRKKRICVIMVLVMSIIGPQHGELNVRYLFVRYRFGWDEMDYALYSTFNAVAILLGTLFSLLFLAKYLKLNDAVLGMISTSSKITASIVQAFAPNAAIFYLGGIIDGLNCMSFIALRSIVSKLVSNDELGKINSLFGVSEALMPLLYGPTFSLIYNTTIEAFPGSFLLASSILTVPSVFIFLWLYKEHLQDEQGRKPHGVE